MKISRREKILLLLLIYITIGSVFFKYFYLPKASQIADLQVRNEALITALREWEEQDSQTEDDIPVDKPKPDDEAADINSRLPMKAELLEVLTFLDQSSHEFNVPLTSMQYLDRESETGQPGVRKVSIKVSAVGGLFELVDYTRRLEESTRLAVIDSLELIAEPKPELAGIDTKPGYYFAPPSAPEAKGARGSEPGDLPGPAKDTISKASEGLDGYRYRMNLGVSFYYYSPETAEKI
jgi:Tfp pilus assembly protein PilO